MRTLTVSIFALVVVAAMVAIGRPGDTAAIVLAAGAPFALFANVMACEPKQQASRAVQASTALLVDWM